MIDNIIQSVTEKLSSLPYIEGIVLGGSRARGTHTEDSDIDIGIYYKSESFDITAINQIATELDDENRNNLVVPPGAWGDWINGGGWLVINGYHVDLILRDIKRVEQIIKDTEQGIVTANYQTGHPHGYISAMWQSRSCRQLHSWVYEYHGSYLLKICFWLCLLQELSAGPSPIHTPENGL